MILNVVGQLDGLDLALPLFVRAWFGTTFAIPDWGSYVRDRPLVVAVVVVVVVVVVARFGAEIKGCCWLRFFLSGVARVRRSSGELVVRHSRR